MDTNPTNARIVAGYISSGYQTRLAFYGAPDHEARNTHLRDAVVATAEYIGRPVTAHELNLADILLGHSRF